MKDYPKEIKCPQFAPDGSSFDCCALWSDCTRANKPFDRSWGRTFGPDDMYGCNGKVSLEDLK